jgi:iron complex transport system substrate-binding protein
VRKRRTGWLPLMIMLLVAAAGCSPDSDAPTEQKGPEEEDHRIISLSVAVTEIFDALEIDLVGVPTSSKKLPERYRNAKRVGFAKNPDMEVLLALKPTDVYSVTTIRYDLEPVFKKHGVHANFLDLTSLSSMEKEILTLGEKYKRQKQAEKIVSRFEKKVEEVRKKTRDLEKPDVLILLGVPGSYLVATEHSYIGNLVKLAGGNNVVQGEKVEYLESNTEYLYESNPDVILRLAHGMPEEVVKMFDEEFKKNDIWKHFDAVKNGRVYDLEEELFPTTATIRADEALAELVKYLYPEIHE